MKVIAEADSVANAVECITRLKPDIVFLDIEIIGGTGFDVLKQIPPGKIVFVVLTTAHQEYGQKIKELNIPFLYKPISVEMLKRVLN
jgi:two-component system LytT family response regulator